MDHKPTTKILAEAIRDACLKAAQEGFEDASIDGLCQEGAIEVALDAIRSVPLEKIVAKVSGERLPEGS